MSWRVRTSILLCLLATACEPSLAPANHRSPSPAAPAPSASLAAPATPSSSPSASAEATPAPPEVPARALLSLSRVVEAPVHDLALGKSAKVVALGAEVWLGGDAPFVKLAPLGFASERVRVFFGRDDRPRLMGHVTGPGGDELVYLRWRDAAWKKAPGELGRLATGPGVLFGVLGHDDPEVVCKVGDACIVKRLTGWTTIGLPPKVARIDLCGPLAWARAGKDVWRLSGETWISIGAGATFDSADGLFAVSEQDVWVADHEGSSLHRFDGKSWSKLASPIAGPRALWAGAPADLWLVGDGGAARWDGSAWTRVAGAPTGLAVIAGRGELLWLGGAAGLWRGARVK